MITEKQRNRDLRRKGLSPPYLNTPIWKIIVNALAIPFLMIILICIVYPLDFIIKLIPEIDDDNQQ
jgi:hypothetical protein